ncbi:MAG: AMP-binding protein [Chloroflexi bacterium]|nr:AMP-binding protein [Chloroflexota bacterium]
MPCRGWRCALSIWMTMSYPGTGVQMGELQVRGPWVISQYYKREITEDYMTADGWFRTGDVCTINEDGFMTVTDRTKDLIKSGGEWISSVELENELMAHPQVVEAAVIAIPDERWSERPFAAVVPTPDGHALTEAELKAFLETRVAKFWIPETIVFVEEIPKTSVGKFSKQTLRKMYTAGQLQ